MIGPWQTRFIILCVSALPIIVSFTLFEPEAKGYAELWRDLIKDLGVVIGALTIVDLVWALVGGEPTRKAIISLETNLSKTENTVVAFSKLTQDAKSAGLARVGANSSSLSYSPREIITLIQNSRKNIDLSGWALVLLHENSDIIQALTNAAGRNVKIRIVVAAPDNRWLEGSNDKKVIPGMKGVIEGTLAILKSANDKISEKSTKLQVRVLRENTMTVSVLRFDDLIQVVPYLISRKTSETVRFLIKGVESPLFCMWLGEFEQLFDNAEETKDSQ